MRVSEISCQIFINLYSFFLFYHTSNPFAILISNFLANYTAFFCNFPIFDFFFPLIPPLSDFHFFFLPFFEIFFKW